MDTILIVTTDQEMISNCFGKLQGQLRILCTETLARAAMLLEDAQIQVMILDCLGETDREIAFLNWVSEQRPTLESILLVDVEKFVGILRTRCRNLCRILKPAEQSELMEFLQRALEKVHHADLKRIDSDPGIRKRQEKRFWNHLLNGTILPERDPEKLPHIPTTFDYANNQQVLPVFFSLRRWKRNVTDQEQENLRFGVHALCKKRLIQAFGGAMISQFPDTLLALLYGPTLPDDVELRSICEEIGVQSETCFQCDISSYFGKPCFAYEIREQVRLLLDGDRQNVTIPQGVFSLKQITVQKEPLTQPTPRNWMFLFNDGRRAEFYQCIEEYFFQAGAANRMDGRFLLAFQMDFIQEIGFALKQAGIPAHKIFLDLEDTESRRQSVRSVPDMLIWVQQVADSAMAQLNTKNGSETIAQQVCRYIDQDVDHPFTRQDFSELLHLSESHIARAFRTEMGMSISSYIAQRRTNLAKELLQNSNFPVSIIAERVGYKEYSYFYKTFKKVTGQSPADYRSQTAPKQEIPNQEEF